MDKRDIDCGDLSGLDWDQLKDRLEMVRFKRKQNMVIQVLSQLLAKEDNPYCEEECRIKMAMFNSHVKKEYCNEKS